MAKVSASSWDLNLTVVGKAKSINCMTVTLQAHPIFNVEVDHVPQCYHAICKKLYREGREALLQGQMLR